MHILAAKGFSFHPKKSGGLLGQGAVVVIGPQPAKKRNGKERLEMTTLTAASHVSYGSRTVSLSDFLDLGRYFI